MSINFRNQISPSQHTVAELLKAIKANDEVVLNKISSVLDLQGLDADYQGVIVDPAHYDPDEIGLDYAAEILRDVEEIISEERAAKIEAGGKLTDNEQRALKQYIMADMEQNSDGANATLWFAEIGDGTGNAVAILHQYDSGEREFVCFSEDESAYMQSLEKNGIEVV